MLIRYRIRYRFFLAFQRHERMSGSRPLFHSHSLLRVSVLPRTEFLFSCANLGHWPKCLRQTELPCPRISAGERSSKYPGPGFWMHPGIGGPNRTHLFSLSPCLSDSVVQRSCFFSAAVTS